MSNFNKVSFKRMIVYMALMALSGCTQKQPANNEAVMDSVMEKLLFPEGEDILIGGDGAISIQIDKKTSLWLWGDSDFGDSTGDTLFAKKCMIFGNVFVVLNGNKARTVIGGDPEHPQPVIASEPVNGKHAVYWPHHGFIKNGILHLFAANVVFGGSGMWDFYSPDVVYFRLSYPDFKVIDQQPLAAYSLNRVDYGFGLHEHNGYYYCYGNQVDGFFASLHAGRARLVNNKLQDWEYFDGTGWSTDPQQSRPLSGIDVSVSSQFSIFKHKNKFILTNQERGIGANDIYTFIADSPTGPWYNKKLIYSTPEPVRDKNLFAYNAMAHPQYDRDGMLLISYCINKHKASEKISDYRPRFIRVPYQLIINP